MNPAIYRIAATAAVSWLLACSAHAQTGPGRNSADVEAEAVAAAHAPNQNIVRGSRGAEAFTPVADPDAMQRQAMETARAPNQNITRGSRGFDPFTSSADEAAIRAQATAAAAAPDQNVVSGSRYNSRVISTMRPATDGSRTATQTNR